MTTESARAHAARPSTASILRPSLAYVVLFASVGAYFPYIAVFYREIGIGLGAVGLLVALSAAIGLVAAPAWGTVADRATDVRVPIVAAALASAASAAFLAVAREPIAIAAAVVLLAASTAGLGPMLDARTIELLGHRDRFGRARAWGSAAFIVGSLVTGAVVDGTSAAGLFVVQVPFLAATALAAYLLLGGGPARERRRRSGFRSGFRPLAGLTGVLRVPTLGVFFAGSVALWTSVTAVTTFVSIHLVALGGDAELVGILWSLGAVVEVPLMFTFPGLARRFGAERLLVLGAVAYGLRSVAWALTASPLVVVAISPLGGIGFALFYVGTVSYVARAVPADSQATAQGLFSGTAYSLGSILGSAVGGLLAVAMPLQAVFGLAGFGTAFAALAVWRAVVSTRAVADRRRPVGDARGL